jgi:hypothetical protein
MPERIQICLNIDFSEGRKILPREFLAERKKPGRNCRGPAIFAGRTGK